MSTHSSSISELIIGYIAPGHPGQCIVHLCCGFSPLTTFTLSLTVAMMIFKVRLIVPEKQWLLLTLFYPSDLLVYHLVAGRSPSYTVS